MLRPHSTVASPSLHCAMSGLGFGGSFQNPGNVGWLAATVNYWLALCLKHWLAVTVKQPLYVSKAMVL